jgi:prepilin-type N-terminal cleavage/methylation domain-containing protein
MTVFRYVLFVFVMYGILGSLIKSKNYTRMTVNDKKGFTLIELLIVVAIIGLLATLAIVSLTSAQQRARDTKRIADVKAIQTAMELHWNEEATYPSLDSTDTNDDDWSDLSGELSDFVSGLPVDPDHSDGTYYTYAYNPANNNQFVVGGTLEDTGHVALDQDDDSTYTNWDLLLSDGNAVDDDGTSSYDCSGTGVYCLTGDATAN